MKWLIMHITLLVLRGFLPEDRYAAGHGLRENPARHLSLADAVRDDVPASDSSRLIVGMVRDSSRFKTSRVGSLVALTISPESTS